MKIGDSKRRILFCNLIACIDIQYRIHCIMVSNHYSFRHPGCSRRIDHICKIFRFISLYFDFSAVFQTGHRKTIPFPQPFRIPIIRLILHKNDSCPAVTENLFNSFSWIVDIYREICGSGKQDSIHSNHLLPSFFHKYSYRLFFFYSHAL